MRKRKKIQRQILALMLAAVMIFENQGIVHAAENSAAQPISEEQIPEELSSSQDTISYDEETGLKMQTMTLDRTSAVGGASSFDREAHLAVLQSKDGNVNSASIAYAETSDDTEFVENTIGNEYIEFTVQNEDYDGYSAGRFTIGTIEGNPNYASDNNQILLFGHPNPGTSYTTIQINGTNYIFRADTTTFDAAQKTAISTMTIAGVKVIQTLRIVRNDSTNLYDTVKISYSIINMTSASKRIGVRIMLDTMLGDNDGAPFKVPSRGNVTTELELTGSAVPAYWQAFDSLTDASVFAIGTIYKGTQQRKPDKVQFAAWERIYNTDWNYTVTPNLPVTNDSAVAFYWNPISVASGSTISVETDYGAGLSSMAGGDTPAIEMDLRDKYVLLVTDSTGKKPLAGAKVTIDGVGTATTDTNGNAVFSNNLTTTGQRKKVTIESAGYRTKILYRNIKKEDCSAAGLSLDNGKPYIQSITVKGTNTTSYANYIDLMSESLNIQKDTADEGTYYSIEINATGNGKGNINRYTISQNGKILVQEPVTSDTRTVRLFKKDLTAGQKVFVQVETDQGAASEKYATFLLVTEPKSILGEDSKDTKGKIKLGGSGLGIKIPDNVAVFGGMELDMELPYFPLDFEAFSDGTVKVSIGFDSIGNSWEKTEKEWDKLWSDYENGRAKLKDDKNSASWKLTSKFKMSMVAKGYAEGKIEDDGHCNINLMMIIGVKGEYKFQKQYIVAYIPIAMEFKAGAQGTYSGGGIVTIGKNSIGETKVDFEGNKGKIDIDIYATLFGGLGIVGILNVGGEGEGHLLYNYDFANDYYSLKVKGHVALKATAFMFSAKFTIAERTWTIADGYSQGGAKSLYSTEDDAKSLYQVLYDPASYTMMDAGYQSASPDRSALAQATADMFKNVYPAAQPKVVNANNRSYMFWLADDNNRSDADRTKLVYARYESGAWSEPASVWDNGTADFDFDVKADGSKIHIVWQDMAQTFGDSGWERLSDAEKLALMAEKSDISYACIDVSDNSVIQTKITSSDDMADMMPKLVVNNGNVYVSWYTNTDNDILQQKGENVIHMTQVSYSEASNAAVLTIDDKTPESEESEPESSETGLSESETPESEESEPESSETEPSESETPESGESEPESSEAEPSESKTSESETSESAEGNGLYLYGAISAETEETSSEETTTEEDPANEKSDMESSTEDQSDSEASTEDSSDFEPSTENPSDSESSTEDSSDAESSTENPSDPESPTEEPSDSESSTEESTEEMTEAQTSEEETAEELSVEKTTEEVAEEETAEESINLLSENEKIFTGNIENVCTLDGTPIVDVNIGVPSGKVTVAYITDHDKDLNTVDDHALYVWDAGSKSVVYQAENESGAASPQFARGAFYWYADGQIYYITSCTPSAAKNRVTAEDQLAVSDNFYVMADGSILWTGSEMTAMDTACYVIYKSDYSNGGYTAPYKLVNDELHGIGDISAFARDGKTCVAFQINYLDEDTADIIYEEIASVTDLTLENIEIDHTSVQPGIASDMVLSLTNSGSTDITTLNITAVNTADNTTVNWTEAVDITRGESKDVSLSHTILPPGTAGVQNYLITVTAAGEPDNRISDNAAEVQLGYTDVAVTSMTYYSEGDYFSNVIVQNNTGVPAENVILRVRADEADGAILFEKNLDKVDAYKSYALQLNLLQLAGNSDIDEIYITVDTSTEDYIPANNTEMEYLRYIWREEETYKLTMEVRKGDSITTQELGNYYAGDLIKVKLYEERGYNFAGWSTADSGYFYDNGSYETYFSMPDGDTVITATYIANAFIEQERSVVVGESLLIAPVYDGTWEVQGNDGIAQIRYSGQVAKLTGLASGDIVLRYISNGSEEPQSVTVHVYELENITITVPEAINHTLRFKPADIITLEAQGITTAGQTIPLPNVTWTVKDPKTASLDDVVLKGIKSGKTTLTAQAGSYKTSIAAEVYVPVTYIYLSSSSGSYMPVGSSMKLKAFVSGYNGLKPTNAKYTWSSSNTSVASVNTSGTVKANAAGTATIYATAQDGSGVQASFNIAVTGNVTGISATATALKGYKNASTNMNNYISIRSTSGIVSNAAAKWKSSNSKVVNMIGSFAFLRGRGNATITASYGGKSVNIKITVNERVEGVTISGSSHVPVGKSISLSAKPTNTKANNKTMAWSISAAYDENGESTSAYNIATLTNRGKLTGVGKGWVYVKASATDDSGKSMTKKVEVTAPVKSVTWLDVTAKTRTVVPGEEFVLTAQPKDADGNIINGEVTYKSSNVKVASIYAGHVYAFKKGSAKITASYGGKSVSYTVKVVQPVESLSISGPGAVPAGGNTTYKATYAPANANTRKVDWIITKAKDINGDVVENASSIATISNGKLKAMSEGTVTIKAVSKDGYGAVADKTVTIAKAAGTVTLAGINGKMFIGSSQRITANVLDKSGNALDASLLEWKSSNAKVASYANGRITALKKGTATITASYSGQKASVKITVAQPVENISIIGNSSITVGKSTAYKVSVTPNTASSKNVEWKIVKAFDEFDGETDNISAIATVSKTGSVKAAACGTIYLQATALDGSGISEERVIKICGEPDSIVITGRKTLSINGTTTLTATVFDQNMNCIEKASIKWSCKEKNIATVDSYGKITALRQGSATITAKCGKKTATYTITVL